MVAVTEYSIIWGKVYPMMTVPSGFPEKRMVQKLS